MKEADSGQNRVAVTFKKDETLARSLVEETDKLNGEITSEWQRVAKPTRSYAQVAKPTVAALRDVADSPASPTLMSRSTVSACPS